MQKGVGDVPISAHLADLLVLLCSGLAWWMLTKAVANFKAAQATQTHSVGSETKPNIWYAIGKMLILVLFMLIWLIFVNVGLAGHIWIGTPWRKGPLHPLPIGQEPPNELYRCAMIAAFMSNGRPCETRLADDRQK